MAFSFPSDSVILLESQKKCGTKYLIQQKMLQKKLKLLSESKCIEEMRLQEKPRYIKVKLYSPTKNNNIETFKTNGKNTQSQIPSKISKLNDENIPDTLNSKSKPKNWGAKNILHVDSIVPTGNINVREYLSCPSNIANSNIQHVSETEEESVSQQIIQTGMPTTKKSRKRKRRNDRAKKLKCFQPEIEATQNLCNKLPLIEEHSKDEFISPTNTGTVTQSIFQNKDYQSTCTKQNLCNKLPLIEEHSKDGFISPTNTGTVTQSIFQNKDYQGTCTKQSSPCMLFSLSDCAEVEITPLTEERKSSSDLPTAHNSSSEVMVITLSSDNESEPTTDPKVVTSFPSDIGVTENIAKKTCTENDQLILKYTQNHYPNESCASTSKSIQNFSKLKEFKEYNKESKEKQNSSNGISSLTCHLLFNKDFVPPLSNINYVENEKKKKEEEGFLPLEMTFHPKIVSTQFSSQKSQLNYNIIHETEKNVNTSAIKTLFQTPAKNFNEEDVISILQPDNLNESSQFLNDSSKKCLEDVVKILMKHYDIALVDCFSILEKNKFNILTTLQELQVVSESSPEVEFSEKIGQVNSE